MINKFFALEKLHLIALGISVLLVCCSCNENQVPEVAAGRELAEKYCNTCHGMPDPALLDKTAWKDGVLPNMAARLGIKVIGGNTYAEAPAGNKSMLTIPEWQAIVDYYEKAAPEQLALAKRPDPLIRDWSIFELRKPSAVNTDISLTTLVAFDTIGNKIFTGDGGSFRLIRWSSHLVREDSLPLGSPPVNVFFSGAAGSESAVFTTLGTMKANNVAEGKILALNPGGKLTAPSGTIATSLPRPVQAVPADINRDERMDWVVCSFGHDEGALSWFGQLPDGHFKKHGIMNIAGALQAVTGDYNHDGWTDLMVLFGNGDECIRLFLNDQKGNFTSKKILSFPAVYGSASFQLVDFNKDGLPDILYACGDNNDYSPVLKPYHGIYLYLNQGNDQYTPSWFYPVNGCTRAVASDFDQDGDLDIASIAFYADLANDPGEKFIYFEQDKPLHFIPHSPPIEQYGRWICMDVNDYDHDGDPDIILGNFAATFSTEKNTTATWDLHLPYIVLRNKKISK